MRVQEETSYSPEPSMSEKLLQEVSAAEKDFSNVLIDNREVDPENEAVIKSLKLRLINQDKVLTVFVRVPTGYPSEPLSFSHGNMKNVSEANALESVKRASQYAIEISSSGLPALQACLSEIKRHMMLKPGEALPMMASESPMREEAKASP